MRLTYLQLCQRLRRECVGVSGVGPSTTTGQTGDMQRIVEWVASAYEDVQNLHTNWNFLRQSFSFDTVAAQQDYTPTEAGAADIGEWRKDRMTVYLTAGGVGGETYLTPYQWQDFHDAYLFSTLRSQQGFPVSVGIKPDRGLALWPIPGDVYTVRGEYWRAPHAMAADDDVPILPEKYHMLIVWRALVFYAGHAAAPETFTVGQQEHRRMLSMMRRAELPEVTW